MCDFALNEENLVGRSVDTTPTVLKFIEFLSLSLSIYAPFPHPSLYLFFYKFALSLARARGLSYHSCPSRVACPIAFAFIFDD